MSAPDLKEAPKKSIFREYGEALLVAFIFATIIRVFLVSAFTIPSGSMLNTIQIGDYLLVSKLSYGVKLPITDTWLYKGEGPERGDIIVFKYPRNPSIDYIKRVIGLPGETIEIKDKVVYIDGKKLDEDYTLIAPKHAVTRLDNMDPFTVPEDEYFVMGDNRNNSEDSRVWGTVGRDAIYGKAWRIYWSWDKVAGSPRLSRLGSLVE